MYIYVFSPSYGQVGKVLSGQFQMSISDPPGMARKSFVAFNSSSIPSIVTVIANLAGGPGSIDLLRLCAHGNNGSLALGTGLDASTATHFSALAGLFAKGGMIELHGCGVASDTDLVRATVFGIPIIRDGTHKVGGVGHKFLSALAAAAKVPVKGGINIQLGGFEYGFEGPTLTVGPGGTPAYQP